MGFVLVKGRHKLVRGETENQNNNDNTKEETAALKFAYKGFGL